MSIRRRFPINKRHHYLAGQDGFTIIELMIATSVLSLMLVMVTVMMINIGNLYYKGISQARIQDNVRSLTDEIASHLELGDNFFHVTSGSEQAYCIGSVRYTYILGAQIGTQAGQSPHVLWRDANPTPGSCPSAGLPNLGAATPSANGTELIAPHSRLTNFSITDTAGSSPYTIAVGEAYGDTDLLTGTTGSPHCKGSEGDQFCATANLTTTVVRRLP
ncbi:MAG TPA: prepilin-type N-terminal cleavage/methylation domain-containing protein [Candidatus Saccharimonadales bacterium]|nr:prepilin-type N-terminal cleavage/methylation domain-containing protein [Candidatus Saccharimonadales bacterium]